MSTAVESKHRKKPAQKSFFQRIALPVVIILAGLMVLMYPVVATPVSYTHLTLPTNREV